MSHAPDHPPSPQDDSAHEEPHHQQQPASEASSSAEPRALQAAATAATCGRIERAATYSAGPWNASAAAGVNDFEQHHEAQSVVSSSSSGGLGIEGACKDILRELYWYVLRDREVQPGDMRVLHVVRSLQEEGLVFWRDGRFVESQDVALRFCDRERTPYTNRVSPEAQDAADAVALDYGMFVRFVTPTAGLFLKAFSEELVIPDWSTFTTDMTYHYHEVERNRQGANASYIPILRDANPEKWGLSICSIDGQRFSIGDSDTPFTLQSVSKPATYAHGLAKEGPAFMDEWIGVEPAGRPFNTQDLDPLTNCPFNSSVNSGAIMAAGVLASGYPGYSWKEVVDKVRSTWYDLCGNDLDVGFSKETFESEKETAYNNFAIAYNLKGRRGLPRNVNLHTMLDVYLGCCSIEMTTDALAVAAATLANGGVCPITRKEVFPAHVTRTVLSEIMLCGMYDQAGRFAVEVGLPSKSGVSGALLVIAPNLMGMALFSPRLNPKGNSVRGIEFCKRLVASYRVHVFEPLRSGNTGAKVDPHRNGWKNERSKISRMAWAVEVGDKYAIRLRDIFLFALCQTAVSSLEGLSDRMVQVIRENYEMVYQAPVDETLLKQITDALKQNPSDMRYLENLTKDVVVLDSLRSLIILAMIDIIMIDHKVDEVERHVAVRIAVLLGIDESVATMEINRYEANHVVGHRFKSVEYCQLMDVLDADVSHRRTHSGSFTGGLNQSRHGANNASIGGSRHGHLVELGDNLVRDAVSESGGPSAGGNSKKKASTQQGIRFALQQYGDSDEDLHVENAALRREIANLRKKLDNMSVAISEQEEVVIDA
jgi:glutaminase